MRRYALFLAAFLLFPGRIEAETATPSATPLQAAQRWLHTSEANKLAKIIVRAQMSKYAVVAYSNAIFEGGDPQPGQLLAERFPFGWQLVDMSADKVFHTCELQRHRIDPASLKAFRAWTLQTPLKPASECAHWRVDVGPAGDIAAVRRLMDSNNHLLEQVHVVQRYAVAAWLDGEGGEDYFKKTNGAWKRIDGASWFGLGDLARFGIPVNIAKALLKDL